MNANSLPPTKKAIGPKHKPKGAWNWLKRVGNAKVKADTLFKFALAGSIGAHAVGLVCKGTASASEERVVQIPVMLEADEPPPPPPPEQPPPPKKKPKPRPASLPKNIDKVVEGDGLRTGDLVDAEEGEYSDEPEPVVEPEPEPEPPPPPPPPKKKVDKIKLTRQFLSKVRSALAARKTYPFSAERMGITGAVSISFVIEPNGQFTSVRVRRSSGHSVLDNAALQTVRGLSGQFARPPEIGNVPLRTSVVLRYSLDG